MLTRDPFRSRHDGLVLVGAQAIFLHTGDVDEAIATETKDADLALDPPALHANPLLETAMTSAGFHLDIGVGATTSGGARRPPRAPFAVYGAADTP